MLALSFSVSAASPRMKQSGKKQPAPADEVKALVDRVQAFYEKTTDFSALFKQEYTYQSFNRKMTSEGKVFFLKPAMMRWEYQKPSPKSFVLTGEKVYAYDPEAMTLTIASFRSNQLSASVTFLWGQGRLEKEFAISRVDCSSCQGTLLELIPHKPDPRFQKIKLEVDPRSAQVLRSIVIDPDGSENAITFTDFKANQKLSKEQFKLEPPPGTQVVDLTKRQH
jgi:outer membrane lipoprotein carrier protein